MTKTLKIAEHLFRAGTATVNKDDGTVRMSISSDAPYERFDYEERERYFEVLDHSPGGIDLTRMNAGTSVLFNHDADVLLGRQTSHDCDGHKLYINAKMSNAPDVASHRMKMEEGILVATSVGYQITGDGVCTGAKDGIPIYRFPWQPYESSMVTIEADITVGVGRSRALDRAEKCVEIAISDSPSLQKEVDEIGKQSQKPIQQEIAPMKILPGVRSHLMLEKPEEGGGGSGGPAVIEKPALSVAEYKGRCKTIDDFVSGLKIPAWKKKGEELAAKHKAGDADFIEFHREILPWLNSDVQLDTPNGGERQQGSGITFPRDGNRDQKRGLTPGMQVIGSKDFQERAGQTGRQRSITIECDMTVMGIRGKVALAQRAGFTSSDLSAINIAPQQTLIALGMERLTIMDLISPGTTSAAAIPYPKETSFGTLDGVAITAGYPIGADTVGERGLKPTWEPDVTTDTANVRKIAVVTKVPDEFIADFPGFQSYIDARLPAMVDFKAENQILYGDGIGNNLKGIITNAGVQTRAYATDWFTTIRKAITDIEATAFFTVDGIGMHPYDWEVASLEKDANGQPYAGGPFYLPYGTGVFMEVRTFWGKPVVVSVGVKVGRPVVGAWKLGAQYFMREGMRIETTNSNEDDFKRNLIALRAEERLALATYRPNCFLEVTGGPART